MSSSPQMIQVYHDEEGSVGEHAPFLPQRPSNEARPRWTKDSCRRTRFRRLAIASGTFITLYLFFCTWVAYARNEIFDSYDGPDGVFPHPRWPFPKRPPHHPPPHPRHPPPRPTVLGCKAVPVPSDEDSFSSVELKVTLPKWHVLVLEDHLLWGDVSVSKVDPDSDMTSLSEEKNLTVGITVANRTFPHPPKSISGLEEDVDKENKGFVLCALSFDPPRHHKCKHPPPPPPPPEEGEELALTAEGHPHHPPPHHPHPHPHPPFFPPPHVLVAVLPAHNETYPRLPGPHGPPPPPPPPGPPPHDGPEGPEDGDDEDIEATVLVAPPASVFSRAWRSTISFLFPMLPVFSDSFPKHWTHPFPHHPPHGHPHPPPPFIVTELTVSLPKHVPVKYGLPFRPLPRPWRRH